MDCIFCKIIEGSVPSYKVFEDKKTLAFLDIFGATDGHAIVIHKRHEVKIFGYTKKEIQEIFLTVQKVTSSIEKAFNTTYVSIGINHGEPAGVKHLHVHIMPRAEADGGGIMQSLPGKKITDKNFAEVAKKIREAGV